MVNDKNKTSRNGGSQRFTSKSSKTKNVDFILPEFNILEHLSSLEIVKELPGEYHCRMSRVRGWRTEDQQTHSKVQRF